MDGFLITLILSVPAIIAMCIFIFFSVDSKKDFKKLEELSNKLVEESERTKNEMQELLDSMQNK